MICTASVTTSVPRWMEGKGRGWVTAEYAMLPASTGERKERDSKKGRPDGRSTEIQRLIGRSLRGVVDLDGAWRARPSTSTATCCRPTAAPAAPRSPAATSPCGSRSQKLLEAGELERDPLTGSVAAISCGDRRRRGCSATSTTPRTRRAEVDANVVMTGDGGLVEVQATAERTPVSRASLDELLALAEPAIAQLREAQAEACGGPLPG